MFLEFFGNVLVTAPLVPLVEDDSEAGDWQTPAFFLIQFCQFGEWNDA